MQGLVGELCCSITFINFCFQAALIFTFHLSSLLHSPRRIFSAIVSWLTALPECETMVPQLVKSTTSVYTIITTEFLPTPAKSHYTFNLRALSKVSMLTGQSSGFAYGHLAEPYLCTLLEELSMGCSFILARFYNRTPEGD